MADEPAWDLTAALDAFSRVPEEPAPSRWRLPEPQDWPADDLVAVGADLAPGTLLAAYRVGLFPMHLRRGEIGWWSPDPRGIVPLDGLRVTRSLRQSCRRFTIHVDTGFADVVRACATVERDHGWIDADIVAAYEEMHRLGWAHSVEVRDEAGALAGGLYGLRVGGLFAGESMFHRRRDASKVALVALVATMRAASMTLLDVQWATTHLSSLGAIAVPRAKYLALAATAVQQPTGE